jgi:serine protease Do
MKKVVLLFLPWLFSFFGYKAIAQDDEKIKKEKQQTEEIVIRKNNDKDTRIVIEINGDKVLINGKPLVEFREDGITIDKRKMIIRDGEISRFNGDLGKLKEKLKMLGDDGAFSWSMDDNGGGAFLGVSTEQVEKGAQVTEITKESGAEKAGLQKDDIITKVDDKKIEGPASLSKVIREHKPKDEVKIYYLRKGKEKSVKATLGEVKSSARTFSFSSPDGFKSFSMPSPTPPDVYGLEGMKELERMKEMAPGNFNYSYTFPRRQKLGLKIQDTDDENGVKVLEVADSSAAANAGIKKDDIITEISGVKVNNTDDAREQLMENEEKAKYTIRAKRNGTDMSFDIKIPKKLKTANL